MEDKRLRFIARLLDGESMTALCAEFGISRKTGYKIHDRVLSHARIAGPLRGGPVVEVQDPTHSLTATNGPSHHLRGHTFE